MESFRAKAFERKSCITVSSTICCQDLYTEREGQREGGREREVSKGFQLGAKQRKYTIMHDSGCIIVYRQSGEEQQSDERCMLRGSIAPNM